MAARTPFKGGAGIDSFWNLTFAAPPTGLVPPYLFGALMSVRTEPATCGLWVYDPNSVINKTGFEDPFANGVSIRGSVEFPVTIGGLSGHQGFVALYSTESGTDLSDIGDTFLPPGKLGQAAAAKIGVPTLAILGKPGPGNANRNATAMLAAIPGCKTVEIPAATHCDFEAKPSALCHRLTGSKPDPARTAGVHETLLRESSAFLKTQPPATRPNP